MLQALAILIIAVAFTRALRVRKGLAVAGWSWFADDSGRAGDATRSQRVIRPRVMRGAVERDGGRRGNSGKPPDDDGDDDPTGDHDDPKDESRAAPLTRFLVRQTQDCARFIGAIVVMSVLVPVVAVSAVLGRWRSAEQLAATVRHEFAIAIRSCYRLVMGNIVALLGMSRLTRGIESRISTIASGFEPRSSARTQAGGHSLKPSFPGYKIVGTLKGGGSGGKLYVATPMPAKSDRLERLAGRKVGKVVIKSFSLRDGSSLPQIVRENRALDAAKKLGLVLEHELTPERFYYVMRFVPGESLGVVTKRLHEQSGNGGLDDQRLREALELVRDLLETLDLYHAGGLWHKDVKPENIIIDGKTAHLVDLGLVTPLRSAMTLTTHGTEYFRDPELVRRALRGEKVHEVDCTKFDIYAAGAVLYSVIENSFPGHGGLSEVTRRCPEAVRWVIRRAMTDYDKRYATARAMLSDIDRILREPNPMRLAPASLPSMGAGTDSSKVGGAIPPRPQGPLTHGRVSAEEQRRRARERASAIRERIARRRAGRRGSNVAGEHAVRRAVLVLFVLGMSVMVIERSLAIFRPSSPGPALAVTPGQPGNAGSRVAFDATEDPGAGEGAEEAVIRQSSPSILTPGPSGAARIAAAGAGLLRDQLFATEQRVLVVSSLASPISPEQESAIAPVLDRLRALGYRIVADPIDPGANDRDAARLAAEAIRIRAQRPLSAAGLGADVRGWLKETASAEFVLWVDPNPVGRTPTMILHEAPAPPGDAVSRAIHAGRVGFTRSLIFDGG